MVAVLEDALGALRFLRVSIALIREHFSLMLAELLDVAYFSATSVRSHPGGPVSAGTSVGWRALPFCFVHIKKITVQPTIPSQRRVLLMALTRTEEH
jgi:hypothetical protein